jgi:hypothetical protein
VLCAGCLPCVRGPQMTYNNELLSQLRVLEERNLVAQREALEKQAALRQALSVAEAARLEVSHGPQPSPGGTSRPQALLTVVSFSCGLCLTVRSPWWWVRRPERWSCMVVGVLGMSQALVDVKVAPARRRWWAGCVGIRRPCGQSRMVSHVGARCGQAKGRPAGVAPAAWRWRVGCVKGA